MSAKSVLKNNIFISTKIKKNIVNSILLYILLYFNATYYNNALLSWVNVFLCICIL